MSLFDPVNYPLGVDRHDELVDSKKIPRAHWKDFLNVLNQLGQEEYLNRHDELKRLLRENGVTYNVYGDPNGFNRPWKLDSMPYIVPQKEWNQIENGLVQRAKLLNLVLKDIYGNKELIKEGLLPIELIYNHNGFLRQADQIKYKNSCSLTLYGVDLARNSKGEMWVVSDRTQAPSGLGYCLENRAVMNRALPDFFKEINIRKLSGFTQLYKAAINDIAVQHSESPKIVLLTPGPLNETYFEHAYVAAFMGYTLVQGDDLVIRDNYVWVKSLHGLEKVDVIIRRLDDVFCDPLELKEDSTLGVPGLLEVVRNGNVSIANPIGSAVLENPGLMAFLPNICKYYFNETLSIPSIATWWCGQKYELEYVLDNLQHMKVKTIYRQDGTSTISEGNLSTKELDILKKKILEKPYLYVGQELIKVATSPSFTHGKIEPCFASFRNFLIAYQGQYHCMPGGLTRSSDNKDIFKVSNQLGGYSKDTWILGAEPPIQLAMQFTQTAKQKLTQTQSLSSRAAENLYWTGRYIERIKMNARYIGIVIDQLNQGAKLPTDNEKNYLENLLKSLTHLTVTYPGFLDDENGAILLKSPYEELLRIIFDKKENSSLSNNINYLRRTLYAIRDKLSLYTWRSVYRLEQEWTDLVSNPQKNFRNIGQVLENIVIYLSALIEMNAESAVQEHCYVMIELGRRIEKAMLMISLIRSSLTSKNDEVVEYRVMESMLLTLGILNTYRSRYRSQFQVQAVIDLYLLDPTNPGSLMSQVEQIQKNKSLLPSTKTTFNLNDEERLAFEIYASLKLADSALLAISNKDSFIREELDLLLSTCSDKLQKISMQISTKYFSHLHLTQQTFNKATEHEEI
jgi:uncharacterized circularly permuted ATP-grasp superfamily protein/uncharacterized alpha-E superfamily protein